jgi:hypothetical protein
MFEAGYPQVDSFHSIYENMMQKVKQIIHFNGIDAESNIELFQLPSTSHKLSTFSSLSSLNLRVVNTFVDDDLYHGRLDSDRKMCSFSVSFGTLLHDRGSHSSIMMFPFGLKSFRPCLLLFPRQFSSPWFRFCNSDRSG